MVDIINICAEGVRLSFSNDYTYAVTSIIIIWFLICCMCKIVKTLSRSA